MLKKLNEVTSGLSAKKPTPLEDFKLFYEELASSANLNRLRRTRGNQQ